MKTFDKRTLEDASIDELLDELQKKRTAKVRTDITDILRHALNSLEGGMDHDTVISKMYQAFKELATSSFR